MLESILYLSIPFAARTISERGRPGEYGFYLTVLRQGIKTHSNSNKNDRPLFENSHINLTP